VACRVVQVKDRAVRAMVLAQAARVSAERDWSVEAPAMGRAE
jgi:hypothetical protein